MPKPSTYRFIRPDRGLPIILHARVEPREVVITSSTKQLVEVKRHYNVDLSVLDECKCDPPCASSRIESFVAGVLFIERIGEEEVWEEVLLQLPEAAIVQINRFLLTRHNTTELRGAWFTFRRRCATVNSSVVVEWRGIAPVKIEPFDTGWCLIKRRSVSVDFFAVPRHRKPRVPLGGPQGK